MKKIAKVSRKSKAIRTTNTIAYQQQMEEEHRVKEEKSLPNLEKKLLKLTKRLKSNDISSDDCFETRKQLSIVKAEINNIQLNREHKIENDNNNKYGEKNEAFNKEDENICKECESSEIVHDTKISQLICQECGYTEFYLDDDTPQWSDEVQVSTPFKYTRINNFRVHLQRLQGVEAKTIPDEVIENLRQAFVSRRIDLMKVNRKMIRERLKDIGIKDGVDHTKYYNNSPTILSKLTNQRPPILSQEFIEELERDFLRIEKSFERHIDKFESNRTHFFSYNFVFNKLFRKMQESYPDDENISKLIDHFPLLKSRQKLVEQDRVWKYIANDMNWTYFRST
jgi:predicted nucleic-acid-binding Zn-ribbon protein